MFHHITLRKFCWGAVPALSSLRNYRKHSAGIVMAKCLNIPRRVSSFKRSPLCNTVFQDLIQRIIFANSSKISVVIKRAARVFDRKNYWFLVTSTILFKFELFSFSFFLFGLILNSSVSQWNSRKLLSQSFDSEQRFKLALLLSLNQCAE